MRNNNLFEIERFTDKPHIRTDCLIPFVFALLFIIVGFFEKNLFLPSTGLGLLEHLNIWMFLLFNLVVPSLLYLTFKKLKYTIDKNTLENLKQSFDNIAKSTAIKVLYDIVIAIGFCCFVGNSLQNAHIINQLSFDFWDSTNFMISYIVSRLYKLYLFAYFIPTVLIFIFILVKSLSENLQIKDDAMQNYPITNYEELKELINFGLNIILIIVIPIICFSSGAYFIHNRFDVVTTTALAISLISVLIFLNMYILLVNKFHVSINKYKIQQLGKIDSELVRLNKHIFELKMKTGNNAVTLEDHLKKVKYLLDCREKISKISKFPFRTKTWFTILSPCLPTLVKFGLLIAKDCF